MKFDDRYFSKTDRFSFGIELESGKPYISIPVSNGLVEYEEQYEISANEFDDMKAAFERARSLAELCRQRKNDDKLLVKPGRIRGEPI